ncbi:class I SAM-dependent methyltransferase [Devosia geojensis]|uniref:class I SAM-dependent methyltransferase n=1 Tax=Devosia geojensis TaxID=443610 RepID=UPI00069884C9|nr:class I SAM-dependent methyltransferase [Devosia geojensis]
MKARSAQKVDFDEYADRYEALLQEQLSFFSGERSYFSEYKVKVLRDLYPEGIDSILDFGAGIGLGLPHYLRHFPETKLSATDISAASLQHIERAFPTVEVVKDENLQGRTFDLIVIATVMHHVAPPERRDLIKRLETLLSSKGRICIFEHNPYNPVTQRMVSTCPFDEDAVLLTMGESKRLLTQDAALSIAHTGYTLFFPGFLAGLRPSERFLKWLPLGGQYYVVAERK